MLSTRRNVWIAASAKPIIMSDMYDKDAAAHTYDQAGAACVVQSSALIPEE